MDHRTALSSYWTSTYEHIWGGFKRAILPNGKQPYSILLGPGRGVRLKVDPALGGTRILLGRYEPPLMRWLGHTVAPGTTFYDIGSNTGHVALIAAHMVGETGRVYAFECDAATRAEQQQNIDLNPHLAARLVVVPYAAGRVHDPAGGVVAIDVLLRDRPAEFRRPDAIKVDVEGAEMSVLEGMTETFDRQHPAAFVECHSEDLEDRVQQFFTQRGRGSSVSRPSMLEVSRVGYNSWISVDRGAAR